MKKKEFSITFGYKAIVEFNVKAKDKKEAIEIGKQKMNQFDEKVCKMQTIGNSSYSTEPDGIIDLDKTWNQL